MKLWFDPNLLRFEITGPGFSYKGQLINGYVTITDPEASWASGLSWAQLEDACADQEWDLRLMRERLGADYYQKPKVSDLVWRSIGFTGTREGMTKEQKRTLKELLIKLHKEPIWFRHGDCTGGDEEGHNIAFDLGYSIIIHPPDKNDHRAFCQNAFSVLPPRPYLERDQRIVDASHILLAAPLTFEEQKRSGTWATIRMALKAECPIRIIFPDGSFIKG